MAANLQLAAATKAVLSGHAAGCSSYFCGTVLLSHHDLLSLYIRTHNEFPQCDRGPLASAMILNAVAVLFTLAAAIIRVDAQGACAQTCVRQGTAGAPCDSMWVLTSRGGGGAMF
ncbi:hypothetical protein OH76DRAFT_1412075 [Lentinus brumalis]|uniref:Uncharacterized protein n=1 Tax=Lentinus brumalis TaxID=2498619 RepID=A0A371CMI8_9APHY|nr:hypothetical protein OH76DRAFT_1412075 [Polyporus brumalis]